MEQAVLSGMSTAEAEEHVRAAEAADKDAREAAEKRARK
jgi:hypothetical protein